MEKTYLKHLKIFFQPTLYKCYIFGKPLKLKLDLVTSVMIYTEMF